MCGSLTESAGISHSLGRFAQCPATLTGFLGKAPETTFASDSALNPIFGGRFAKRAASAFPLKTRSAE